MKWLLVLCAVALSHIAGIAQPAAPELSRHLQNVQARSRVLPLDAAGAFNTNKKITLDGKLDEWGAWNHRSGLFVQDIDHLAYQLPDDAKDAAGVKLLRDEQALYIAVRVLDASVYNNTKEEIEYIRQDCVELFFDVRPVAATGGSKLGDSERGDGFYQLFFVPPTPARVGAPAQSVRWCSAPAQAQLKRIGALEAKGSLQPGGYDLEIRIPFASFHNGSRERFADAIGFDVFVNDMDIESEGNGAPQVSASHVYSWGGLLRGYADPSRLAAAAPGVLQAAPFLRTIPARMIAPRQASVSSTIDTTGDGATGVDANRGYSLRAGVIAPLNAKFPAQAIGMTLDYAATAFDTPGEIHAPATKLGEMKSRSYPSLDATFFFRDLTLLELPGGRYTCNTTFNDALEPAENPRAIDSHVARYYAWTKEAGTTLLQIPPEARGVDVNRAFRNAWVFVEPVSHFPDTSDLIEGRLSIGEYFLEPAALWEFSEQAEQATRQGQELSWKYQIAIRPLGKERPARTLQVPFRAFPTRFAFPAATLAPGDYEIEVTPIGEKIGADIVDNAEQIPRPELVPITISAPRSAVMAASVQDAPKIWRQALEVGSPNRKRHPLDDAYNAPQRSVCVLQLFENRIYVGSGIDYNWRPFIPPTTDELDIWSFSPAQAKAANADWQHETRMAISQVAGLRVAADRLYVNAIRNRWWQTSFPIHVKAAGKWETISQPTGWQLNDVLPFEGKLYAAAATEESAVLLESSDKGRTWKTAATINPPFSSFNALAPLPQGLLATVDLSERGAALYRNGKLEPLRIDLFPNYQTRRGLTTHGLQPFANGVVYTVPGDFDKTATRRPLFYLQDFQRGAVQIEAFSDAAVQDIKVRGNRCYVLTAAADDKTESGFIATVFSSSDLKVWTKHAVAVLPALPNALEITDDAFFIGLANRRFGYADSASGSVWAIRD